MVSQRYMFKADILCSLLIPGRYEINVSCRVFSAITQSFLLLLFFLRRVGIEIGQKSRMISYSCANIAPNRTLDEELNQVHTTKELTGTVVHTLTTMDLFWSISGRLLAEAMRELK